MKYYLNIFLFLTLFSCNREIVKKTTKEQFKYDFTLSFGSCDNQNIPNLMWDEILKHDPDVFIWGGDIVYSDTQDMILMKENFNIQKNDPIYKNFSNQVNVMGTWDDHDYGLNDGGVEYTKKDSVQQILLDFLDVDMTSMRRTRQGVYHSRKFTVNNQTLNIIVLDSRYFRTQLTKDPSGEKRYIPNSDKFGTMLGEVQWTWLADELNTSKADFNLIVSGIQFLSNEHGFECWGNMPHEVEKMKQTIAESHAKGVIFLSGDRHIAEISKVEIPNMDYPLIDFTSSGLTHSYSTFNSESNKYRVSKVIADKNFGLLKFNMKLKKVKMEIRGEGNVLYETYEQNY